MTLRSLSSSGSAPRASAWRALCVLLLLASFTASCSSDGFGRTRNPPRLVVELDATSNAGAPDAPLPLAVDTPIPFKIVVRALAADGSVDTSFNRHVRISGFHLGDTRLARLDQLGKRWRSTAAGSVCRTARST